MKQKNLPFQVSIITDYLFSPSQFLKNSQAYLPIANFRTDSDQTHLQFSIKIVKIINVKSIVLILKRILILPHTRPVALIMKVKYTKGPTKLTLFGPPIFKSKEVSWKGDK